MKKVLLILLIFFSVACGKKETPQITEEQKSLKVILDSQEIQKDHVISWASGFSCGSLVVETKFFTITTLYESEKILSVELQNGTYGTSINLLGYTFYGSNPNYADYTITNQFKKTLDINRILSKTGKMQIEFVNQNINDSFSEIVIKAEKSKEFRAKIYVNCR